MAGPPPAGDAGAPWLPTDLLDQLPVSLAVHGLTDGFPLLYRNRRQEEVLKTLDPGAGAHLLLHPGLRELARSVVETGRPGHVEIGFPGAGAARRVGAWTLTPLVGPSGELAGIVAVVEDRSQPVLARRRMESAIDHGMHLLLEIARLSEERSTLEGFLSGVGERLALLVQAERIAFNSYDPARRALVSRMGSYGFGADAPAPSTMPCDPEAADLLSQVVFAGRVYRGRLDLTSLEFRPYAHLDHLWRATGTQVLLAPWRAGNERLGAVAAYGTQRPGGFTEEDAIVLIVAGHAAGLVWQRKRAEQQLAERALELESLERAKSAFLRLASHELRTPLTLLNGYVSLLNEGSVAADRETLGIMLDALRRMNELVGQITEATRLEDGALRAPWEAADLRALVRSAVAAVVPRGGRAADFTVHMPRAAVPVTVDVQRVQTAAGNLLDNAFKYSTAGDRICCEVRVGAGVARLIVKDEGIGISDEEMAGLFTRFGRIVNHRNSHIAGTGLGLYLSREIARMHGGDVTAASAPGRGSRFEMTLPLREECDDGD